MNRSITPHRRLTPGSIDRPPRRGWRAAALAAVCLLVWSSTPAGAKVRIVATTPTIADLARQVGGDLVRIDTLMRGNENPHNVVPKPSFIMKLRKADLFLTGGLDGEPWVPTLIRGARKTSLRPGGSAYVDLSVGIALKEVPAPGQLSRANGDIHIFGNTHYLLDPLNGAIAARTIADALARVDPAHADRYRASADALEARLRDLTEDLTSQMAPYAGAPVVVYHRAWPYFLDRFGLIKAGEIEPKPGIPPGPRHLSDLAQTMRAAGARVVIVEPYNSLANARSVAQRAGAVAVVLATNVGGVDGADTYEDLFRVNIARLREALEGASAAAAKPARGARP